MSNQKKKRKRKVYPASYKLKLVKLHEEDGYRCQYLCEQTGVGHSSLTRWVVYTFKEGPDCFKEKRPVKKAENKTLQEAPAVREKIIEIKEEYPVFGIQRISDLLKRVFFLKASPETVRKTLHQEEMMPEKPRKKPKKNPQKPRFLRDLLPIKCGRLIFLVSVWVVELRICWVLSMITPAILSVLVYIAVKQLKTFLKPIVGLLESMVFLQNADG